MGNKVVKGVGKSLKKTAVKPLEVGKTTKKYIVFDFGSVLRVRNAQREETVQELIEILNKKLDEVDPEHKIKRPDDEKTLGKLIKGKNWKPNVGIGKIERHPAFLKGFAESGIKYDTKEEKKFIDNFIERFDFENKVILKDMHSLLKKLKGDENVVLAVISNHSSSLREWLTEKFNLIPDIFDDNKVVISAEEGVKKPDERIFEALLSRLDEHCEGFNREEDVKNMIFIDNKAANCEAAEKLGMEAFHYVHDPSKPSECVSQLSDIIFTFLNNSSSKTKN